MESLHKRALAGQCELFYFDESGFSPNQPIQYGWSHISQVRSVEPQAHRQRVNVLGALRQDGKLVWCTQQRPTLRNDVIAFCDRLSEAPHSSPRTAVIDHAAFHKGDAMDSKRQEWAAQGLYLYYLPPYSPELNRIEILWKQAKYYCRRFCSLKSEELLNEVTSTFNGFGADVTINFA
jgi:transposase